MRWLARPTCGQARECGRCSWPLLRVVTIVSNHPSFLPPKPATMTGTATTLAGRVVQRRTGVKSERTRKITGKRAAKAASPARPLSVALPGLEFNRNCFPQNLFPVVKLHGYLAHSHRPLHRAAFSSSSPCAPPGAALQFPYVISMTASNQGIDQTPKERLTPPRTIWRRWSSLTVGVR